VNVCLKSARGLAPVALILALAAGCASHAVTIVPKPPANPQKLGRVQGTASGSQFLGVFPIRSNSRTERAYQRALSGAPGATALTDVTVQENWFSYGLGTVRIVTISGEAVK